MDSVRERELIRRAEAYERVFSSEDGKLILDSLLKEVQFDMPSIDKEPLFMAYNDGRKATVQFILNTLNRKPLEVQARIKQINEQRRQQIEEVNYR